MNIQILDSWLREYLETKATAREIAKYVSLCGPTFDRTQPVNIGKKKDWLYDIEVTSNRVDAMSVYGLAREATAILPQFGIKAKPKEIKLGKPPKPKKSLPFKVVSEKSLVYRTIGVVIDNITNWQSPDWISQRLEAAGIRSLNSVVDITNYVMTELGQPMHVFDYDKIKNATIIIRASKKGEKIVSLENKTYKLLGGDIIFQSTDKKIIDLPGIIGTKNSVVSKNTKRFLFFVDSNDPVRIRKTSMALGIRTVAATLNEKSVDPELGITAILRAIKLVEEVCKGRMVSKIYDNYPTPLKTKEVKTDYKFITDRLGINITKLKINQILKALEFEPKWSANNLTVKVPSFRYKDIAIPEDIVEEIARIYGYHKIPSNMLKGKIPNSLYDSPFTFEKRVKNLLSGWGAVEVYTYSLVAKEWVSQKALKLKNPLGAESEYLRTSLLPSLKDAAQQNKGQKEPFHLFEIANVYLPRPKALPKEKMILAGIFSDYTYREAKGVFEALLEKLNISYQVEIQDENNFLPSQRLIVESDKQKLGEFGVLTNGLIYYEFDVEALRAKSKKTTMFKPLPKYPAQIEDVTLILPQKTKVGEVISFIQKTEKLITKVELTDIYGEATSSAYKDAYTLRFWYQTPNKTLTNEEVEKTRKIILGKLNQKFGAVVKD